MRFMVCVQEVVLVTVVSGSTGKAQLTTWNSGLALSGEFLIEKL